MVYNAARLKECGDNLFTTNFTAYFTGSARDGVQRSAAERVWRALHRAGCYGQTARHWYQALRHTTVRQLLLWGLYAALRHICEALRHTPTSLRGLKRYDPLLL